MATIVGTSNRILEVNLSDRTSQVVSVSEEDRRHYLGGKGLGLKLMHERLAPGIDPLGPDNLLVFMMGVMMGTGAPCSGRFAALTKSPLTDYFWFVNISRRERGICPYGAETWMH